MSYKDIVLKTLKPKVAPFGFTKKEIESVAAVIADNLGLDENAEDEVVNATIDKAVNTMIPVLQLAQSQANRSIERYKAEQKKPNPEEDEEQEGEESNEKEKQDKKPAPKVVPSKPQKETPPEWANSLINTVAELRAELGGLKNEKLTSSRKQRLENALKDTGVMGQQTLRNFAKMKFETDEEFDDYLAEVETSVTDFRKEQGDASLKTLGKHPQRGSENLKELTDSEIDKIVGAM